MSWAGWFQTLPAERRNWTLEPDPSLVRAAGQVEEWYASGLLTTEQETVFFASEAEDTFAWFLAGPEARSIDRLWSAGRRAFPPFVLQFSLPIAEAPPRMPLLCSRTSGSGASCCATRAELPSRQP